jgi:hypothetical protein
MPFDEETERRSLGNDPALTSLDLQSTQVSEQTMERLTLALNCSTHIECLVQLALSFHLFDDLCSQYTNIADTRAIHFALLLS